MTPIRSEELLLRSWPVLRRCLDAMGGQWTPAPQAADPYRPFVYQTVGGCTLVPDILERYAQAGLLRREFFERAHLCPECAGSSILFREVCPECGGAGLERPELLHHFTCAGVFPKEVFGSPESLQCPKCRLELRFIGVDYEYLKGTFNCMQCGATSSVVPTGGRCMACDHRFAADEAGSCDWYRYECNGDRSIMTSVPKDVDDALSAFTGVAEERSPHVRMHLQRMRAYCRRLGHTLLENRYREGDADLTREWCRDVAEAALLHDIGNAAIEENLLFKPGVYTPDERASVARHVQCGSAWLEEMIRQFGSTNVLERARQIVSYHHERWDGSGYGEGRAGQEIPLEARLVAVADVYDATRRARSYRSGLSHDEAVRRLDDQAGRTLDPAVVKAFAGHADKFAGIYEELT